MPSIKYKKKTYAGASFPVLEMTKAEYDALSEAKKMDGTVYMITDDTGGWEAENASYDNTSSGLTATNVQDALDEVVASVALERIPAFQKSHSAISNVERAFITRFGRVCFVDLTFTTSSDINDNTAELFNGLPPAWNSNQRFFGFNKITPREPIVICVDVNGKLLNQWSHGGIPAGQYQASFTYICAD